MGTNLLRNMNRPWSYSDELDLYLGLLIFIAFILLLFWVIPVIGLLILLIVILYMLYLLIKYFILRSNQA